jgi:hypothetical protein
MVKSILNEYNIATVFIELLTTDPPLPHILSHINSFYNFISYLCLMSIFSSHLGSRVPSCLFPTSFFLRKICKHLSFLTHVCTYVSPISLFFVEQFNNLRTVKIEKLLIMLFSPFSCHFQHLKSS